MLCGRLVVSFASLPVPVSSHTTFLFPLSSSLTLRCTNTGVQSLSAYTAHRWWEWVWGQGSTGSEGRAAIRPGWYKAGPEPPSARVEGSMPTLCCSDRWAWQWSSSDCSHLYRARGFSCLGIWTEQRGREDRKKKHSQVLFSKNIQRILHASVYQRSQY